jgi:hypothetical protein
MDFDAERVDRIPGFCRQLEKLIVWRKTALLHASMKPIEITDKGVKRRADLSGLPRFQAFAVHGN